MNIRFKIHRLGVIVSDVRYVALLLQRRIRSPKLREKIAAVIARQKPAKQHEALADPLYVKPLETAGISHLGPLLTPSQLKEVKDYLSAFPVHDPYQPGGAPFMPIDGNRPPNTHVGYYAPETILQAPHLLGLANAPFILSIVEAFLGCRPTIGYLASWWSFAADGPAQAAERFHRDVDDWRFVKLFIYLTDVDDVTGPHIYVQHSANDARLTKIRRYTDPEVSDAFGESCILRIKGAAGSAFLENTFGLHKGEPVSAGHRLIFQAVYSISGLPYAPKKPISSLSNLQKETDVALDGYINRLYCY